MKRSRVLKLSLLGTAPLALVACGSKDRDLTYESVQDCIEEGRATPKTCSTAFNESFKVHYKQAPRFYSEGSCLTEYGNCLRYQENGSNFWIPVMSGFLAGRYVHSYGSTRRPYVVTNGDYGYRPLYRSHDDWNRGTWSTWGSGTGGSGSLTTRTYGSGRSSWGSSSSSSGSSGSSGRISTSSVSRGGFGGSSSASGGWGGS
ncbi:MAG: DUF1190 domain-containing protein [Fibrobacteres bacterium]|nr:DUF1190 domain-containing protein [Fibrobacterota bacterium]